MELEDIIVYIMDRRNTLERVSTRGTKQNWNSENSATHPCDIVVEVVDEQTDHHHNAGSTGSGVGIDRRTCRPHNIGTQHADAAPEEQGPAAETIDEESGRERRAKVEDLEQPVDQGLVVGRRDADRVEHQRQVVRDHADAVPLGKHADAYHDRGPLSVAWRRHESAPPRCFRLPLLLDRLDDLGQFSRHEGCGLLAGKCLTGVISQ